VALTQAGLLILCWFGLGLGQLARVWICEEGQARALLTQLASILAVFGLLGGVALPVFWFARLLREGAAPGLDTDFVRDVLAFPQRVAVLNLAASVCAFFAGAVWLRRRLAIPPIESGKAALEGLCVGTLLGALTYFALAAAVRPLLRIAVEAGAVGPAKPFFPVTDKAVVVSLALVLAVVSGLGVESVAWGQRFAEEEARSKARALLQAADAEAGKALPRAQAEWVSLLRRTPISPGATLFVLAPAGTLWALWPIDLKGIDAQLVQRPSFLDSRHPAEGAFTSRWVDVRAVDRKRMPTGVTLGALVRPDPGVMKRVASTLALVAFGATALALLLGFLLGRNLEAPLTELGRKAALLADDPGERPDFSDVTVITDDETAPLAASLGRVSARLQEKRDRSGSG